MKDYGWLNAPRSRRWFSPAQVDLKKCMFFPGSARAQVRMLDQLARDRALDLDRARARNRLDSGWGLEDSAAQMRRPARQAACVDVPVTASEWTGHPVLVGLLLLACPPMGLALLWASPHYSRDARVAITLAMSVMAVCATVLLAR